MSMDVVMQCLGGAGSSSSSSHAAGAAGQLPSKSEASLARGTAPSPRAPAAGAQQPTPQQPTQQQHHHHHRVYVSPPCCSGCGAAKASGGICSGCGGAFCRACMGLPATASSNSNSNAPDCANCSSLCSSCKPVACCFCEEMREQAGPVRMCEACAGTCDVCQRAACGACRAMFSSCSSCGFAACEGCVLQLQLQCGSSSMSDAAFCDGLVGPSGKLSCWCAPPLRTAGTVSAVSSQRYQMAQLHPSMLAATMEATGLRDADYDEDDVSYDEDDIILGRLDEGSAGGGGSIGGGGGLLTLEVSRSLGASWRPYGASGGSSAGGLGDPGASSAPGGDGGALLHQNQQQQLAGHSSAACLSPKQVEALIGALPALSPSSSTHSSTHSSGGHHHHPQAQLAGPLGGAGAGSLAAQLFGLPISTGLGVRQASHQYHHCR